MIKLRGIPASRGTAIASIHRLFAPDLSVTPEPCADPDEERERFARAIDQAKEELGALYDAASRADPGTAAVFDVHRMMLDDPDFYDAALERISAGENAAFAVRETADGLGAMFEAMEDEYMRARADDVADISKRVIRILKGIPEPKEQPEGSAIVVAEDLLPSQTVRFERSMVAGFVTKCGSITSHSVILARTMGIPCVVGLGEQYARIPEEGTLAVDGGSGEVVAAPDEHTLASYRARMEEENGEREALERYRGREAAAPDGRRVLVAANIGSVADVEEVLKNDGDGVGLFRSEFLYLESADFPDEQTQFEAYRAVLSRLAPRPVVIRTLDLGSDKQAPYFDLGAEENPALGLRAIRISLKRRDIFACQLRALLRASVYGKLCIMFPLISHLEQMRDARAMLDDCRRELEREGVPFARDVQIGVMVETPAAALISDALAREADFFSIGTNDLTQYTLAVDRVNPGVAELFDSAHPAVLRLIELTAKNAHENGIWVGVCGESAADASLTEFYLSVGIDELSVAPASILRVKRALIESGTGKK